MKTLSARLALFFIGLVCLAALLADWLAPYSAEDEQRAKSYHPPTAIHFFDVEGNFYWQPFVYDTKLTYDAFLKRHYQEDTSRLFPIKFGMRELFYTEAPARLYLLGADSRGRDLFSRILYGSRVSLGIALLGVLIASFVGFLIGALAGYFGGRTDQILMRVAEFFILIPAFYFLLALRGSLPAEMSSVKSFALIIAVLSLLGWGGMARVIRGMVLSIKTREFVIAARMLGRSHWQILRGHIFPHTLSYLAIVSSIALPAYILAESALSLLGLGIQEPVVSLGNLLQDSMAVAHIRFHPWILAPGLWIMAFSLACYSLGNGLQESRGDEC